jgi:hypothetical protein
MGKRDLKFGRKEHNNNDKVLNKYYTRKTPNSSSRNINFYKKPFHQPEKLVSFISLPSKYKRTERERIENIKSFISDFTSCIVFF